MKTANLLKFGGLPSYRIGLQSYNQDQLGLGELMIEKTGSNPEDKYVGPFPTQVVRPMEASTPGPVQFPWAMQWTDAVSSEIDWIFFADATAAAATRKLYFATYDRKTATFNFVGFVTLTFPGTSENKTVRGMRMKYAKRTAGTVQVSGTAVTGTGTAFTTADVGNRIGFGSTDPTQITTWYPITAIANDGGLTIGSTAGTIGAGTPYVIEQLSCVMAITSATVTNGGLYMVKGLAPEIFTPAGGAVPAAATTDKIRAVYHLADASTVTNTVSFGMGMENEANTTTHNVWVLDTLANPIAFKYNINAALTLTAGKATSAFLYKSGSGGAVTGTTSQNNNGRIANMAHGPGSGINCLYFTTTTRIYRSINIDLITNGAINWLADNMPEIPPGSANLFAAGASLNSIEYSSVMDMFIVCQAGQRPYLTKYKTDSSQIERILFMDTRQQDQSTADPTSVPVPSAVGAALSAWIEGGMLYIVRIGTTAAVNQVYAIPLGADWEYATLSNAFVITPRIATPNATKFLLAAFNEVQVVGGATGRNLGLPPEPFRAYCRTAGISDDSGGWTAINSNGDLSALAGAEYIQFKFEFRVANFGLAARIQSLVIIYEDFNTLSNYQPSASKSDVANKRFAWFFATAFGSTVPALRVRLYDAVTGALLVDDNTAAPTGTFERSTNDGGAWSAWNNTDRGNPQTYLRYTPASLADNIKVRAVLTLN